MIVLNKDVLLLKAPNENENDKYESILLRNGFTIKYLQILDFQYINLDILRNKLINADDYTGIIFTSPRGVIATKNSNIEICKNWQNKNNYVVGETTFNLTKNELNLICKGKESGNANNLADMIISEASANNNSRYLFPCGNLKKETLGKRLKEHNITIDDVTVYETIENKNLSDNFLKITENFEKIPEYIVFFSPSGVKFLNKLIKNILHENIKLIAIGPSTEEELQKENLPVYGIAKKPNEIELLNAILNIK